MEMLARAPLLILLLISAVPVTHSFDAWATLGDAAKSIKTFAGIDTIKSVWKVFYGLEVTPDPTSPEPLPYQTSLSVPSIKIAQIYVHYSAASYCEGKVLSDYTCNECKKTGPSTQMVRVIRSEKEDTQGFVSIETTRQEIIVTFRGTHNPANLFYDIAYEWVDSPYNDGIRMYKGFYMAAMSLYDQVLSIVKALSVQYPNYKVVITGHSVGGSMSTVTYYLLSHDLPNLNYVLITFGEPRLGNKALADYINKQNITSARVVNELDLVPHVIPASLGFVHHLTEFWKKGGNTRICNTKNYEDLNCSAGHPSLAMNTLDHLTYMGTSIGLNCIEENPISGIMKMLTG